VPPQTQDISQQHELRRLRKELEQVNTRFVSVDTLRKQSEQQLQAQVVNLKNVREQILKVERC
jgi:ribosomal protein L29